ncbi:MAG: DUF4422 domain-containing protein [Butyrivibrio sp.]|nr:DUF4422 domain-containing protein [Butyrivibrio sp.]
MDYVIFGAQGFALGAYMALRELYPRRKVRCFIVTEMLNNAPVLGGIPVREIDEFASGLSIEDKHNIEVMIATSENIQLEIEETLENYGFPYYKRLDFDRWNELMKLYYVKIGKYLPLKVLPAGFHEPFVRIYMARSAKDRALKSSVTLPEYVFPVHAGSALCSMKLAPLVDNVGENISLKNGNYCELTVLYWAWKNKLLKRGADDYVDRQYYGLAHYRRFFDFGEDDLLRLVDNDVDVVLPYPLPYEPDIHAHHKRYLKEDDWSAVIQALREIHPTDAADFEEVLQQQYIYNYNIILAKKSVLRDYCEWLFPILERTEELSVPRGSERSDRYIGYTAETLETLYFTKYSDRLNVVHAGCKILI